MDERVSHPEVVRRGLVRAGQDLHLYAPESDRSDLLRSDAALGRGIVVSSSPVALAVRLWQCDPQLRACRQWRVAISVAGPVLAGLVAAPGFVQIGDTCWLEPPDRWESLERRLHPRTRVRAFAAVRTSDAAAPVTRRVLDLSAGGCATEPLPFDVGEVVYMTLDLSPVCAELTLEGRIVRHELDGTYGLTGIEFRRDAASQPLVDYLLWASRVNLATSIER